MLFYRQKFLLATVEAFGGSVEATKFQKYLFLISEQLTKKYYNFVPYNYGCFSFQSYHDKKTLIDQGFLLGNKKWDRNKTNSFLNDICPQERDIIFNVKKEYGALSKQKLLHKVYSEFPYYAINSKITSKANLNTKEKNIIKSVRPKQNRKCIFTIGYEGRSIDEYLNLLIKNNVKVLVDVRKNPLSRKYGFSKKSLQEKTKSLSIDYLHLPSLGINGQLRINLKTKRDYKKLFSIYKKEVLTLELNALKEIMDTFLRNKRIALTCFEAEHDMCHRHCVSSELKRQFPKILIEHI